MPAFAFAIDLGLIPMMDTQGEVMSPVKRTLIGLALILVGAGFTAGAWYEALTLSHYAKWSAIGFPVLLFIGLMMVFAPVDKRMLQEKFGVDAPTSMDHYTPMQKMLVYACVAAVLVNYVALRGIASGWF